MRSLLELQRDFCRSLLEAAGPATMRAGLRIYACNVYGNWSKALASAYPIVRKIVGEPFFEGLAGAYARAHPSVSGDLNEFGAHFPAFVARFSRTRDLPYLRDVARMDWLAHRAYFAADAPRFDPACLAGIPAGGYGSLRWHCAPGSALMASRWPLARLWEVHQDGYRGNLSVDLATAPGQFLVFRSGWRATVESVAQGDFRFLAEVERGTPLGDALQAASGTDPQFDAAAALARWVGKGVLTQ